MPVAAAAADFDGSTPLSCTGLAGYSCDPKAQCSKVKPKQLQLQGTSEKFAWSAVVNRKTGKVTVTIADRVGAYVIFGQCKVGGGS
jgi:hypothetical protein